ncbi:hypothetical protein [Actinomadura opuntiae]|uniref:hypothetical protein n=1 Tax=Actinomadura sp. OS1-43 TaxID=604315 RepID=UPI00255B2D6D|nr:hypothetical protein [Actinomadura sp. OS1-43]MDL4813078.1 hypothetical protein [Actinomadura sp. OS1-43]
MHSAPDRHARLSQAVDTMANAARRADRRSIGRNLKKVANQLDYHSLEFLCRAPDLVLVLCEALTAVLEVHRHPADSHPRRKNEERWNHPCGTIRQLEAVLGETRAAQTISIDAAEAWRRARRHLSARVEEPVFIHIQEFEDGFLALPIQVAIPEPATIPTIETPTALVIDKATGAVTRWPLLALPLLERQYRRYQCGQPMTFDDLS